MKRLAVLRHAKSSWDDARSDDFNRPLDRRGWTAARALGRELTRRRLIFDLVLSSTAARTRETIDGIRECYDFAAPIEFEPALYLSSEGRLLEMVQGFHDGVNAPLIVGHNPGLEQLVAHLTRDDTQGLRKRVAGDFPTCALALIDVPAKRWSAVGTGSGEIVELILPEEID